MTQYLVKYIDENGKAIQKIVDEANDIFGFFKIRIGGVLYDSASLGTVSGLSALEAEIDSVSGASSLRDDAQDVLLQSVSGNLSSRIDSVSGASSLRDDIQDLLLQSVSGTLQSLIFSVSGASSLRDDTQDLLLQSVSGVLFTRINAVSGASSLRDDAQDLLLQSVSGVLFTRINSVSGASSLRDDAQDLLLQSVSASIVSMIGAVSGVLQTQIDTINNTYPIEEYYECLSAGHRLYSVSGFSFDSSNSRRDIQVFRNIGRLKIPKDYLKVSSTSILLNYDVTIGDEILIDKRR